MLVLLLALLPLTKAGQHERRLLKNLLHGYNVRERPVIDEDQPVQLTVEFR